MKKQLLILFGLITILGSGAEAAVIYLKDGSQIHGTIVSSTARDIQVYTPDGTLTISTDRIARVEYSEQPAPAPVQPPPPIIRREPVWRPRREPTDYGRQFFSLGLGVAAPLSRVDFSPTGGGSDSNGDPGFLLSGQYLYGLTSKLSLGTNIEYFNRSATGSQSLLPNSNTDVYGHTVLLLATLKYSFVDQGFVRPYILGAVGANNTTTTIEGTPNPGFGWSDTNTFETRTLVDDVRWGPATSFRFGLDFPMDFTIFSLEFGWTRLANGVYDATQAGRDLGLDSVTGNQHVFGVTARWGWRFQ